MEVFEKCPFCGKPDKVIFLPDWQAAVNSGAAIAIIGCGNPWHYEGLEE